MSYSASRGFHPSMFPHLPESFLLSGTVAPGLQTWWFAKSYKQKLNETIDHDLRKDTAAKTPKFCSSYANWRLLLSFLPPECRLCHTLSMKMKTKGSVSRKWLQPGWYDRNLTPSATKVPKPTIYINMRPAPWNLCIVHQIIPTVHTCLEIAIISH